MNKYYYFALTLFFGLCLEGQSLMGVNVDNLSDAQILSIYEKGKTQGYTIESGQIMAMNLKEK